jgi:hypothetical protein
MKNIYSLLLSLLLLLSIGCTEELSDEPFIPPVKTSFKVSVDNQDFLDYQIDSLVNLTGDLMRVYTSEENGYRNQKLNLVFLRDTVRSYGQTGFNFAQFKDLQRNYSFSHIYSLEIKTYQPNKIEGSFTLLLGENGTRVSYKLDGEFVMDPNQLNSD